MAPFVETSSGPLGRVRCSPPHIALWRFCHICFFPCTSLPLNCESLGARAGYYCFHPCIAEGRAQPCLMVDVLCEPDSEWMNEWMKWYHCLTSALPLPPIICFSASQEARFCCWAQKEFNYVMDISACTLTIYGEKDRWAADQIPSLKIARRLVPGQFSFSPVCFCNFFHHFQSWIWNPLLKNPWFWTSLVVQWLRTRLPMQGTRVRYLVQEDPTCCGATKPVCHNYWACAQEPVHRSYWAHMPQLLKPMLWGPCATTTEDRGPQQEKPLQWEARAPQRRVAPSRRN